MENARAPRPHVPLIGVTERGDGGLDLGWVRPVEDGKVDAAIVITKNVTPRCADEVIRLTDAGKRVAVHVGCTGWGATWLEPNVPEPQRQIDAMERLIERGLDNRRITLRIDPIVPTDEGLSRVAAMLELAHDVLSSDTPVRVRMSVLDEYRHVKARLRAMGRRPFYPNGAFQATPEQFCATLRTLDEHIPRRHGRKTIVETCAEPRLVALAGECDLDNVSLVANGCVSRTDFEALGLPTNALPATRNAQGRGGCLCLTCKRELLENRRQCPHGCAYCYWRDQD